MKKLTFLIVLLAFAAFKVADVFSDLGINQQQAQEQIFSSFTNNYLSYPSKSRNIPLANRANIVQAIGSFARSYSKTDDFKKRYAEWWKNQEPTKPESPEGHTAREKADLEKSKIDGERETKEMKENMAKQIAQTKDVAIKKQLEEALKATIDMQAQMKKQIEDPAYQQQMKQVQEMANKTYIEEYKTQLEEYNQKMADWKAIQNPNRLIKSKLEDFLQLSSTVDFNAQLKTENNRKQFVNPDYQSKGDNWKRCFRAGKAATDEARKLAQEWIKEL